MATDVMTEMRGLATRQAAGGCGIQTTARDKIGDVQIGIQIPDYTRPEGAATLGPALATVARTADDAGFDSIAVMDHFFQIRGVGPVENDMLEAYTTLGFLAAHSTRAKLLTVVTGVHYRTAGLLAKTVTTLDVLSGGRAWLGIGAAWNEEESVGLGFGFPPVATRFQMLEETLQVCLQMWSGDESPYIGRHYQLDRPLNVPQALSKPHPPIMIGGGGEKKTLRLVAKYADACNLFATPDLAHKLDVLREHCEREGRDYDSITKTAYYRFDLSQGVNKVLDDLKNLHDLGFQAALGQVVDVWSIRPLETIGSEIIPVAAAF
jgi:F420-dependent oxidoreductase-like protein